MSDKSDLLAELVASDAKIKEQATRIKRLRKEVAKLRKLAEWRPIETAPSEGAWALVSACGAVNCAYVELGKIPRDLTNPSCPNVNPQWVTHWMPLPKPPATEGGK